MFILAAIMIKKIILLTSFFFFAPCMKAADRESNPLIRACQNGDLRAVKKLINEAIDVNFKDKNGYTALMYACTLGHDKIVKYLLNAPGIDVNLKNERGSTALMYACSEGNDKAVAFLLKAPGIDVNLRNSGGNTALIYACLMGP